MAKDDQRGFGCGAVPCKVDSHNKTGGRHGRVRLADRLDECLAAGGGGTEIDHEDLVFAMMQDVRHLSFAAQQIGIAQLALEDAVLQVIAPSSEAFENFSQPFGVTNVVSDQIDSSHDFAAITRRSTAIRAVGRPFHPSCGGALVANNWLQSKRESSLAATICTGYACWNLRSSVSSVPPDLNLSFPGSGWKRAALEAPAEFGSHGAGGKATQRIPRRRLASFEVHESEALWQELVPLTINTFQMHW